MLQHPITPSSPSPMTTSHHDVKKQLPQVRSPSSSSIVKKPLPTPRPSVVATPRLPSCKEKQPLKKLSNPLESPTTKHVLTPPTPVTPTPLATARTHTTTEPSSIFTLSPLSLSLSLPQIDPPSTSAQHSSSSSSTSSTSSSGSPYGANGHSQSSQSSLSNTPNTASTSNNSTTTTPNRITSPPMSPTLQQLHSPSSMSLYSMGSEQLLDHSHLKPGGNASLLSYATTINMYRTNAKKTNDVEIQCDFAIFLVEAAKRLLNDVDETATATAAATAATTTSGDDNEQLHSEDNSNNDDDTTTTTDRHEGGGENRNSAAAYLTEAEKLLKQVASHGHSPSQYYLANMYSSGLLHKSNKFEYDKAFPLYVQSAKHHHPDAAYRTAKCYEDGLGTRRDKAKAVQFYRKAATLNHPGAMYRLGLAEMKGDLGMTVNIRDGHKWLKRSAEASTTEYPHALHELAHLHERGVASIIFQDHDYAIRLYQDASDLGYAPSCFRLGECYEFGRLGCMVDPRLSMHYYGLAAEQGHPHACFALTAWYLIGVPGLMEPSDEQAFAWALRAAHPQKGNATGLARAEYAVGYFYEVGIGIEKNHSMAWDYYQKAAGHGEKRAIQRIQGGGGGGDAYQLDHPPPTKSLPAQASSSEPSLPTPATPQQRRRHSARPQQKASAASFSSVASDGWVKKWKQKLSWSKSASSHS